MPALAAGIFLADEKMTGSSPVMMRNTIHESSTCNIGRAQESERKCYGPAWGDTYWNHNTFISAHIAFPRNGAEAFYLPVFGLHAEWSILTAFRNHNLNNEFAGTFRAGVALKQQLDSLISLVR